MKKVGILLITVISAICLCFGLAACGKGGNKKTPLAAPADVAVEGDILSWSAVEGATAGYTVKINSDETTKVTTGTTLDLTTVTGKLHEGSNTLSVKANATDAALESPYSAQKTYTYTPTPAQKQPLATPQNVKVEGDTLSWSAVEGATEGYTVKINDNESTKVTTGTTLDLTTVTALLQKGANTLSVKANATEDALESEYSATATYNYTPSVEQEAADYKGLVEAIGSITGNSTKADADAVKAAIDAAETKYNGLSDEAKALQDVVTAKASYDAKKTAYEGTMSAAEALHTAFANAVTKASATITAAESLETLTSDKTAADAAHTALTTLAQGFVTDEERAAYDNIATTVTEWTKAVNDEKAALEGVQIPTLTEDDATAEDIIKKVNAALEGYDALPVYVKNDSGVKTLHDDFVTKRSAAESQIKSTVDALVEEIETALQNKTEANEENYEALTALQTRVDDIAEGTYAAELFEESGKGEALAEAIEAMESKIVEVLKDEIVLYNNDNKTDGARIVVIRKYVNFKGEGMQLTTQPTVTANETVTQNSQAGQATSITNATVAWNETSGTYVFTIPFTRLVYSADDPDANVVVKYTLSGVEGFAEEETAVTVGVNSHGYEGVCYDNDHQFFDLESGTIKVSWGNDSVEKYISVYEAEDIAGTGDGLNPSDDLYPADLPLFTVTIKEISSLHDLTRELSAHGIIGDEVSVRVIFWQKFVENDIMRYSAIRSTSCSNEITLKVTEADKYVRLKTHLNTDDNSPEAWNLYHTEENGAKINFRWETVSETSEKDLREGVYINVYNVKGHESEIQEYDFTQDEPFAIYQIVDASWVYWSKVNGNNRAIDDVIREAWIEAVKKSGEKDVNKIETQYTFVFGFQVKANETAKEQNYIDSEVIYATQNGKRESKEYTFQKSDIQATNEAQVRFTTNGEFLELLRDPSAGYVFKDMKAARVELKFTKDGKEYIAYLFVEYDADFEADLEEQKYRLNLYSDLEKTGNSTNCDYYTNGYITTSGFNTWARGAYSLDESFDISNGWTLQTRVIVNENSGWLFDGDWSEGVTYTAPTPAPAE